MEDIRDIGFLGTYPCRPDLGTERDEDIRSEGPTKYVQASLWQSRFPATNLTSGRAESVGAVLTRPGLPLNPRAPLPLVGGGLLQWRHLPRLLTSDPTGRLRGRETDITYATWVSSEEGKFRGVQKKAKIAEMGCTFVSEQLPCC